MFVAALGADSGWEYKTEAGAERRQEREWDPEAPAGVCGPAGFSDKRHDGRWEAGETNRSEEAGRDGGRAEGERGGKGRIINLKQPETFNLSIRKEPFNYLSLKSDNRNVQWQCDLKIYI